MEKINLSNHNSVFSCQTDSTMSLCSRSGTEGTLYDLRVLGLQEVDRGNLLSTMTQLSLSFDFSDKSMVFILGSEISNFDSSACPAKAQNILAIS